MATAVEVPGGLTVKTIDDLVGEDEKVRPPVPPDADAWTGGIPRRYAIAKDDKVWVLVVKRWGLKDGFIREIEKANPKIDFKRLRPGMEIVIPDPTAFTRSASEKQAPLPPRAGPVRSYEVQAGDTLGSIAYRHLGSSLRWNEIVTLNPGLDPKRLFEGQEIYLPLN